MNILFYVTCTPSPENGGVERVTYTLSKELKKRGYGCSCAYLYEVSNRSGVELYDSVFQFDYTQERAEEKMIDYLLDNHIDIIVNQFATIDTLSDFFYGIRQKMNIRLITCYHFDPMAEYCKDTFFVRTPFFSKQHLVFLFKRYLYFIYKYLFCYIRKKRFLRAIKGNDKLVFLSQSHIDSIVKYYHVKEVDTIDYIPNPLSFNLNLDIDLKEKKKSVLIVSRLKEEQKKVGTSLEIWKKLEEYGYEGWSLDIVGYGDDLDFYLDMVRREDIKNVHFYGHQNPVDFYRNSSILIMTSPSEGLSMTLIEAKQMGCVPMAMSSIAFTSVQDIINDGKDGYIIASNDINQYVKKLRQLIGDNSLRLAMAQRGIEDSQRFLPEAIIKKWTKVFEK